MSAHRPPPFDPRSVPVVPDPLHGQLQAAPAERLTAPGLRQHFARPPVWTPELAVESRYMDREPAAAAVLLALVMRQRLCLLLTQRSQHLPTHAGQIALPGGKVDPQDAHATAAALREAQEEIGLDPARVEVLGSLPPYTTGSQFCITPVVALVQPGQPLQPNPGEVDEVFEVPLDFLMDPRHHRRHHFEWHGEMRQWYSMPYQDAGAGIERFIWGATAGMLRNFYRFMAA